MSCDKCTALTYSLKEAREHGESMVKTANKERNRMADEVVRVREALRDAVDALTELKCSCDVDEGRLVLKCEKCDIVERYRALTPTVQQPRHPPPCLTGCASEMGSYCDCGALEYRLNPEKYLQAAEPLPEPACGCCYDDEGHQISECEVCHVGPEPCETCGGSREVWVCGYAAGWQSKPCPDCGKASDER